MNGPDWSAFSEKVREAHINAFDFPEVTVYNFTGGYDPNTGETDDWTEDGGTTVQAEATIPETPRVVTDAAGQEVRVRRQFRFRDDANVDIYPVGTDNQRPTEIEHDNQRWMVADEMSESNGLTIVFCTQV